MANRSTGSVPGHAGSHQSAMAPVLDSLGSTQTILAPARLPSMIRWA